VHGSWQSILLAKQKLNNLCFFTLPEQIDALWHHLSIPLID
jgi:hypothetical protein